MGKSSSVWGVELGQSALKAMRCHMEGDEVIVDAFDFIEYPKILSQPEAEPEVLIREALEKFLERNDYSRDVRMVVSLPGSSGLAKFFKPPPVETKKVADIVRYEARQQIPYDLKDVIWDYQMMPGSVIEDNFALESEIGLFAMKREQAFHSLKPFEEVGLEVDFIQMAPLALYNMLAYDRFHERLDSETFDAENPPSSTVFLSIGTDSSDLIITNGFRIWQRSIPLGGNHFTRQLTKELKLTFAKAEHLKRHAREAEDPKLIFQTMRPVFNDLVTEMQRSIGFFKSINKKAEITELVIAGNTVKMPGLAQYLGKNLGYEVHVFDRFGRLGGEEVLAIPTFKENVPTFGVCYGLTLQGLGKGQIRTNLVPQEILTERLIRAKKPWALACVASLLIGLAIHYVFIQKSWSQTHPDDWASAVSAVKSTQEHSSRHKQQFDGYKSKLTYLKAVGDEVSGNSERRLKWLELQSAVLQMLPRTPLVDGKMPSPKELPFIDRPDIYITRVDNRHYEDVSTWFNERRKNRYLDELRSWADLTKQTLPEDFVETEGPTGPGWVIELAGYHDYNDTTRRGFEASNHIRRTMLNSFLTQDVEIPDETGVLRKFTLDEMGISFPILVSDNKPTTRQVPNPDYEPPAPGTGAAAVGYGMESLEYGAEMAAGPTTTGEKEPGEPPTLSVLRQDFTFQFVWQPNLLSERLEMQREKAEAEEEARQQEEAEGIQAGQDVAMVPQ